MISQQHHHNQYLYVASMIVSHISIQDLEMASSPPLELHWYHHTLEEFGKFPSFILIQVLVEYYSYRLEVV